MNAKIAGTMCRKFLMLGSLTALVFIGFPVFANPHSPPFQQPGQQAAQPSAVSGKIVSIRERQEVDLA